eukprot:Selendium_serpulae@DN6027_c0_g1_i1.p2
MCLIGSDVALHVVDTHARNESDFEVQKIALPDVEPSSSLIGVGLDVNRDNSRAAFSSSNGVAAVGDLASGDCVSHWNAHANTEMWCIAFDIASDQCVATGADDCCLKLWDTRAGFAAPTAQNKKHHTMGVTSLAFSPIEQNVLYSGRWPLSAHHVVWICNVCKSQLRRISPRLGQA